MGKMGAMDKLTDAAITDRVRYTLRDIGIPPRPSILADIEQEFLKEDTDYLRLADVIGSDVGLTAGLIKVANSTGFGMRKKVRTVRECLLVLGVYQIVQIIAGLSLEKVFAKAPQLTRFWDGSARNARVSAWLATRLRRFCGLRPEDAYTFGLFRDCGIPLLLIPFPEYKEVLKEANGEPVDTFTAVEDRRMGINHVEMGAAMAETWLLADEFVAAIRHHHRLASSHLPGAPVIPPISWTMIAVSQLAEHLIQLKTGLSKTLEWDKLREVELACLGLSVQDLEGIEADCDGVVFDRRASKPA